MHNPWDYLVEHFRPEDQEGSPHSLDNELIAIPKIMGYLRTLKGLFGERILDFGCGTGVLCSKLDEIGYRVTGIDSSSLMIASARKRYPQIRFELGISECIQGDVFDVIVSVMVLQFIEDLESTVVNLGKRQRTGGYFIFAVHSPFYVTECILSGASLFSDFTDGVPGNGLIHVAGTPLDIYIRTADSLTEVFSRSGYELSRPPSYPPFSAKFLRRFPSTPARKVPKFLIMTFRRS